MGKRQRHVGGYLRAPRGKLRIGQTQKKYGKAPAAAGQHAQGATEYLILLAVVLIIALLSISLLGFFPGVSYDTNAAQSKAYWSGEAQPIQIVEYAIGSDGWYVFVVRNANSQGTITITNFKAGTASVAVGTPLSLGEEKKLRFCVAGVGFPCNSPGNAGEIYELPIVINYTTQYGIQSSQVGAKKLVGKYT